MDLAARHAEVAASVEPRVLDVLRSGRWIGGPEVVAAEHFAARMLGRKLAVGVASGTDALILALCALGVGPGDEVIVPALTFVATAGAVLALGATAAVADVGEDGTLDPHRARELCSQATRAVIPVHLFGNTAALPHLGVPVIEDAAQAIGAVFAGERGVLSTLSTYPTKTWGSAGDGGFVAGDDEELMASVRRLGNHGVVEPDRYDRVGAFSGRNSRLDAVQAAVLLGHAEVLAARVARRRENAARYDAQLPQWVVPLQRTEGGAVQLYCVRVPSRDIIRQKLALRGIGTAIYYPHPLNHQPLLRGCRQTETPIAERLSASLLALPIADVSEAQIDEVINALWEMTP